MCLLHSAGFSALVLYAWVPEGSELDFAQRWQSLRGFPPPECNCGIRKRCQFWTILWCLIFHFRVTIMLRLYRAFTRDLFFIVFTDFCNLLWLLIDAFWTDYHVDMGKFPHQSLYRKNIFLFWWTTVQTVSSCPPDAESLRIIISTKPNQKSGVILITYAWWLAQEKKHYTLLIIFTLAH